MDFLRIISSAGQVHVWAFLQLYIAQVFCWKQTSELAAELVLYFQEKKNQCSSSLPGS